MNIAKKAADAKEQIRISIDFLTKVSDRIPDDQKRFIHNQAKEALNKINAILKQVSKQKKHGKIKGGRIENGLFVDDSSDNSSDNTSTIIAEVSNGRFTESNTITNSEAIRQIELAKQEILSAINSVTQHKLVAGPEYIQGDPQIVETVVDRVIADPALLARAQRLQRERDLARSQKISAEQNLIKAENKLVEAKEEIIDLTNQLNAQQRILQAKSMNAKKKISELENQLSDLNDRKKRAENSLQELTNNYKELKDQHNEAEAKATRAQRQVDRLTQLYNGVQAELKDNKIKQEKQLAEIQRLNNTIGYLKNNKTEIEQKLRDNNSHIDEMKAKYQELENKYQALETMHQALQSEYDVLKEERDSLQSEYDVLKEEHQLLNEKHIALSDERYRLRAQVEMQNAHITELEEKQQKEKQQNEKQQKEKQQNEKQQKINELIENDKARLEEAYNKRLAKLQSRLGNANARITQLQHDLEEKGRQLGSVTKEKNAMESQISKYTNNIQAKRKEIEELEIKNNDLREQLKEAGEKIKKQQNANNKLRKRHTEELEEKEQEIKNRIAEVENVETIANDNYQKYKEKINDLHHQLEQQKSEYENILKNYEAVHKQNEHYKNVIKNVNGTMPYLKYLSETMGERMEAFGNDTPAEIYSSEVRLLKGIINSIRILSGARPGNTHDFEKLANNSHKKLEELQNDARTEKKKFESEIQITGKDAENLVKFIIDSINNMSDSDYIGDNNELIKTFVDNFVENTEFDGTTFNHIGTKESLKKDIIKGVKQMEEQMEQMKQEQNDPIKGGAISHAGGDAILLPLVGLTVSYGTVVLIAFCCLLVVLWIMNHLYTKRNRDIAKLQDFPSIHPARKMLIAV